MPQRACIISTCPNPAISGRSRCGTHGRSTPGVRRHDSRQKRFRQRVLAGVQLGVTRCGICGLPITPEDPPEAGHIIPLEYGGTYEPSNGQPQHRSCNRAEGARIAQAKRGGRFSPDR